MAQEARRANTGKRCSPHVRRRVLVGRVLGVDMTVKS
jgi:hypothetical protein